MNDSQQKLASTPQREKYWTERDREEKLEALREITIHVFAMVQSMQDDIQRLLRHQHSVSGQMMAPLDGLEPVFHRRRDIPPPLADVPLQEGNLQRGIGAIHVR